jgi:hypothetical protein
MSDSESDLSVRVAELERELAQLVDVLGDLEFSLSMEDLLGAAATLSRLRPEPPEDPARPDRA